MRSIYEILYIYIYIYIYYNFSISTQQGCLTWKSLCVGFLCLPFIKIIYSTSIYQMQQYICLISRHTQIKVHQSLIFQDSWRDSMAHNSWRLHGTLTSILICTRIVRRKPEFFNTSVLHVTDCIKRTTSRHLLCSICSNRLHNQKQITTGHLYSSPTNAQVNCLKNNIKIYIKITPDTFWCSHTIFRERIIRAYWSYTLLK